MSKSTIMFWTAFAGAAVFPAAAAFVCLFVLGVQMLIVAVRSARRLFARADLCDRVHIHTPVFSVHVATHDEPPALVTETLTALANQSYPDHLVEIIVIDNNTADPALWRPVAAHCARLGPRFRFLHREGVQGAKAGALNLALEHTRSDVTHIVTIDADYIVLPGFLSEAAQVLRRTGADYVQFPQAYRRPGDVAEGVDIELEEYFRSDARMADHAEAVLLTGTLCVLSKAALMAVQGWSGRTTTEDAELGVRLCKAGFTGRYIPKVVGKGLLPLTLSDLSRQRYRWTSGNLRTLTLHLPDLLSRKGALRNGQVIAIIAQLGAWFNFSLIPGACLLSASLLNVENAALISVASLSILLGLGDIVTRFVSRSFAARPNGDLAVCAIASRLALAPAAARATVDACLPGRQIFTVTRKSASSRIGASDLPLDHIVLFVLALTALVGIREHSMLHLLALGVLTLPLPAGLWVAAELSRYRRTVAALSLREVIV